MKYNIKESEMRTYLAAKSCVFKKNNEKFGELSNMATRFPIRVNSLPIRTTEALYQACRFPHKPDIQRLILSERSPMKVKMSSNVHKMQSREDWEDVRIKIMKWCLNVKLAQNIVTFGSVLNNTGNLDIVENSSSDNFWGAIPNKEQVEFTGKNALGRLLMDLRQKWQSPNNLELLLIQPPEVNNLLLLGEQVGLIDERVNFISSLMKYWDLQCPITFDPKDFNLGSGLDSAQQSFF